MESPLSAHKSDSSLFTSESLSDEYQSDSQPRFEKELVQIIEKNIPPIIEPREYLSFNGVVALVVCPFIQGLFHGLGESMARIYVGGCMGIDPMIALGSRKTNR